MRFSFLGSLNAYIAIITFNIGFGLGGLSLGNLPSIASIMFGVLWILVTLIVHHEKIFHPKLQKGDVN